MVRATQLPVLPGTGASDDVIDAEFTESKDLLRRDH